MKICGKEVEFEEMISDTGEEKYINNLQKQAWKK